MIYWAQQTGKPIIFHYNAPIEPMLDDPALAITEHVGIEHNDMSRRLMTSSPHLWRLTWGGCSNLERTDIQEPMYCLPTLKSRQQQAFVKSTYTVSLTTLSLYLYSPFSDLRPPKYPGLSSSDRCVCLCRTRAYAMRPIFPYSCDHHASTRALPVDTPPLPPRLDPLIC